MTQSIARTVAVPSAVGASYAVLPKAMALQWPMAEPASALDYYLDVSAVLLDPTDTLQMVSIAVAPSGAGQLSVTTVGVTGSVISLWLSGGVAGRAYVIAVTATTAGGRTFEWLVGLRIDSATATFPLTAPPSAGFGAAATWTHP